MLLAGTGNSSRIWRSPISSSGCRPMPAVSSRSRTRVRRAPRRSSIATSSVNPSSRNGASRSPTVSRVRGSSNRPRRTGTRRPRPGFVPFPSLRRISPTERRLPHGPIAVITRHTNLGEARTPSRQELTFNDCANDLFAMIAVGDFPDLGAPTGPRRGAPRASDGLIRLDVDGTVTFASPNALSAFNRIGFAEELEGESLADVTTASALRDGVTVDESLPLVVTGRAPWRTDIEARA